MVFFFNDTATTEIYTLSLHDALPILNVDPLIALPLGGVIGALCMGKIKNINRYATSGLAKMSGVAILLLGTGTIAGIISRSEEHTSELQSRQYLVCRLLLEKKILLVA